MPGIGRPQVGQKVRLKLESFGFEDKDNIYFTFSRLFSKNRQPGKLHCNFFTTKASTLISVEGCKAFSRSLNDKIPFKHLIICFRHYDILAKARNKKTMAITFSRQNDVGSCACAHALLRIGKVSFLQSSSSENLRLSNLVTSRPRRFRDVRDVSCQACRGNFALGFEPPLVTWIAQIGLGTRLKALY